MRRDQSLAGLLGLLMLLTVGCENATNIAIQGTGKASITNSHDAAETITIVGASTPYPAIQQLATAYAPHGSDTKVTFLESSQSSGGIAGVKEGWAEIGTVTRPPKPEEDSDNLAYRALAKDALLVATHPSVDEIQNLTTEALQSIYSGQATNWQEFGGPDAEIIVLDRAEDTSAKRLLRKHYLGPTLQNSPTSIMLRYESDLIEAIQDTPYSIGIISLAKATVNALPVNIISLDGIAPTAKNLNSDKYVMYRTLGIVWDGTPGKETQEFIDFIFSETGADILQQAGYSTEFTD